MFFWHTDLSLIVGCLARRVQGRWPQNDIRVVLWALAGVADEWQNADTLAVSCTDWCATGERALRSRHTDGYFTTGIWMEFGHDHPGGQEEPVRYAGGDRSDACMHGVIGRQEEGMKTTGRKKAAGEWLCGEFLPVSLRPACS